ncbi:MAG: helix-turn-helix transcriptional regulator [Thermoguttaceae bacterium]
MTSVKGQFISVPEAGRRLGRSAASVRRLIARGTLTVIQIPGAHPRVVTADVEAFRPAKLRSPAAGGTEPVCAT